MLRRAMNRTHRKLPTVAFALILMLFVVAGCGGGSDSSSESPEVAMQQALEKTSTITSGQANIKGAMSIGGLPGSISITGGGPFDTKAKGGPAFEIKLNVELAGSPQTIGFARVDGKSYMLVGDKAVEQKSSEADGLDSDQIASFIKELGDYLSGVKETADGTYSGKVDLKAMIEAQSKKQSGDISKITIPGLGSAGEISKSIGVSDITVKVDGEGYAQTIDLNVPIKSNGSEGGIRFTIELEEINQPQTVEKPKNVVTDASSLGAFGAAVGGGN